MSSCCNPDVTPQGPPERCPEMANGGGRLNVQVWLTLVCDLKLYLSHKVRPFAGYRRGQARGSKIGDYLSHSGEHYRQGYFADITVFKMARFVSISGSPVLR